MEINALTLTLIDMTVVFAVLYFLSLVIRAIKLLAGREAPAPAAIEITAPPPAAAKTSPGLDSRTIAAVAAAISAYLGGEGFRIIGVMRVAPSPAWSQAGRQETVARRQQFTAGR